MSIPPIELPPISRMTLGCATLLTSLRRANSDIKSSKSDSVAFAEKKTRFTFSLSFKIDFFQLSIKTCTKARLYSTIVIHKSSNVLQSLPTNTNCLY